MMKIMYEVICVKNEAKSQPKSRAQNKSKLRPVSSLNKLKLLQKFLASDSEHQLTTIRQRKYFVDTARSLYKWILSARFFETTRKRCLHEN